LRKQVGVLASFKYGRLYRWVRKNTGKWANHPIAKQKGLIAYTNMRCITLTVYNKTPYFVYIGVADVNKIIRTNRIAGMVCGLISILAIIALALIINHCCCKQKTRVEGFLLAGDYQSRFNKT
jgi:hypothetical protein